MTTFIILFIAVLVLTGVPLAVLGLINMRRKPSGCAGNHDCITYKGEKVQCPACDLREYNAAMESRKDSSS